VTQHPNRAITRCDIGGGVVARTIRDLSKVKANREPGENLPGSFRMRHYAQRHYAQLSQNQTLVLIRAIRTASSSPRHPDAAIERTS
jgi:hypothetical protein